MPTVFAHAGVAVAVGIALPPAILPRKYIALGLLCAVAPDCDVLAFRLDIPYDAPFGHRGFFHSIFFALLLSLLAASIARLADSTPHLLVRLSAYLAIVTVSHGVLDTFTNGGRGIALLAPFTNARFFSPWCPIAVSPISIKHFLTPSGLEVLFNEMFWVGAPFFCLAYFSWRYRQYQLKHNADGA